MEHAKTLARHGRLYNMLYCTNNQLMISLTGDCRDDDLCGKQRRRSADGECGR